jgi:hypothetical protein
MIPTFCLPVLSSFFLDFLNPFLMLLLRAARGCWSDQQGLAAPEDKGLAAAEGKGCGSD